MELLRLSFFQCVNTCLGTKLPGLWEVSVFDFCFLSKRECNKIIYENFQETINLQKWILRAFSAHCCLKGMYLWKPDNYQLMWKHLLIPGDSHANSHLPLDGSARWGSLPILKPPQPQGTEDAKSSASYVPRAFLGLSNTEDQAMEVLWFLEFMNLGIWSVLKSPKLTYL